MTLDDLNSILIRLLKTPMCSNARDRLECDMCKETYRVIDVVSEEIKKEKRK